MQETVRQNVVRRSCIRWHDNQNRWNREHQTQEQATDLGRTEDTELAKENQVLRSNLHSIGDNISVLDKSRTITKFSAKRNLSNDSANLNNQRLVC